MLSSPKILCSALLVPRYSSLSVVLKCIFFPVDCAVIASLVDGITIHHLMVCGQPNGILVSKLSVTYTNFIPSIMRKWWHREGEGTSSSSLHLLICKMMGHREVRSEVGLDTF